MCQPPFTKSTLRWTKPSLLKASERLPQRNNRNPVRNFVPLPALKPPLLRANRRGLFNWERWDGSLWETPSLRVYHNTHLFYICIRTQRLHRRFQTQEPRSIPAVCSFWRDYYASLQEANQSLYDLMLHLAETAAINFLLRTTPKKVYKRIEDTLAILDVLAHELSDDVGDLHRMRRIFNQQENPVYFIASVQRHRMTLKWRQQRAEQRADSKLRRIERKGSMGHDWRANFFQIHRSRSVYKLAQLHLLPQASFNVSATRWTIEPFVFSLRAMLRELQSTLIEIESVLAGNRRLPHALQIRSQDSVNLARRMGYELAELNTELTALRYYRLHHFPHGSIEAETKAGKLLWQRTQRLKQAQLDRKIALQKSRIASFSNAVATTQASSMQRSRKRARRESGDPSCAQSMAEVVESGHHYAAG